ncbi:MFS transporter [Flexivirga meconopsidis]|uniref:MFS transporter n=1 Tax=Flexivirga meconopsidis TaxID=2977121 RepID=UPI00223E8EEB|nr:MFS transporter [Flexivirga meconopsidis]
MSVDATSRWTPRQVVGVGPFRLLLGVTFLDVTADSMWYLMLGWVAASASNGLVTGVILAAAAIPQVAFILVGGLHTDKYGAGTIVRRTTPIRLALFLLWSVIAIVALDVTRFVAIIAVSLLVGAVAGFHDSAMSTYPTEYLVPAARGTAVSVERVAMRAAQAAGGFLGGLLLGGGGVSAPTVGAAACLLIVALLLSRLRHHARIPDAPMPEGEEAPELTIRAGFDFVRRHPVLSATIPAQGVVNLVNGGALMALLPIKAHRMGWGAGDYGAAIGSAGLGITLGTVLSLTLTRLSTRARTLLGISLTIITCLAVSTIGIADSRAAAATTAFVIGLAVGPVGPLLTGYAREQTPAALVGRVMSILGLVTVGIEPLGSLLTGGLVAAIDVDPAAMALGLAGAAICAISLVRLLPRRKFTAARTH